MDSTFEIRMATLADLPVLLAHRRAMFVDMGHNDVERLDAMLAKFAEWVQPKLERGEYRTWLAAGESGDIAASAGVWLNEGQPGMRDLSSQRAYILNVYTRPEYRRRGLARKLMSTLLDWCCAQGIGTVTLHASQDGRALYQALGFRQTNEMRLLLPVESVSAANEVRR